MQIKEIAEFPNRIKIMKLEMDRFQEYLKYDRRLAVDTIKNYVDDVRKFQEFIGKPLAETTQEDIRGFISQLDGRGLSRGSTSNFIISLRSYFKWLSYISNDHKIIALSFFLNNIIKIQRHRSIPQVPTPEEIKKLRETMQAHKNAAAFNPGSHFHKMILRDIAALELLITSGLRSKELRHLRFNDIVMDERMVLVKKGKGSKQRVSLFGDTAYQALQEYFEQNDFTENDFLFKIKNTNRLNAIVKRWAKRADINPKIHTHSLRHFFITEAQRQGVPIKDVADQVGHVNLNTTRSYTHLNFQYLRSKFKRVKI